MPLALLLCVFACPSWAVEPLASPSPKAARIKGRKAPERRLAPTPAPTPTPVSKPAAIEDDKPPPSTPVDVEPTPEPSLPHFDPSWRACREDKDCVAIDTHCGWGCINGSSVQPASMYYRQLAPFIECAATGNEKPNAICVKKECVCQH